MSNLQFKPNTWAALTYNTTFMHFQICISIKSFLWHKEVVYTATKYDYIFFCHTSEILGLRNPWMHLFLCVLDGVIRCTFAQSVTGS